MEPSPRSKKLKIIGLILGPLVFLIVKYFFHPEGMSAEANGVLASTLWVAIWWILEVIPMAVTALLPIVLFPLSGALPIGDVSQSYGHRFVFLYLGGFMIAIAMQRWNLHKRIAINIIQAIGTDTVKIILGFMVATAFLSMWISNTATSVMMLPIGMAIIAQLQDNPDTEEDENLIFGKALMLGRAYSASIGGVATLIGTPPNLVLAGILEKTYDVSISFFEWFKWGLPISIMLLFICWVYLTRVAFRFKQKSFPGGIQEIKRLRTLLGQMSYEEKAVGIVFGLTAVLWMTKSLLKPYMPFIDDTVIAIGMSILLFLWPTLDKKRALLTWDEAVNLPWGIILLFGGGMAIAYGFRETGLAEWIGIQLTGLKTLPLLLMVAVLIASVNFLTEITSNLATTAMLLPVLAPMALSIDVHPYILMVSATVAASCAFMLPVATPPNAVVFGSGYLRIPDMVRTGIWMNLISIILLTGMVYWVLPQLWAFIPDAFPVEWNK